MVSAYERALEDPSWYFGGGGREELRATLKKLGAG